MNRNLHILSRPSPYDVARMLANRDDAIKSHSPIEIPEMKYYEKEAKEWSLASVYVLIKSVLA